MTIDLHLYAPDPVPDPTLLAELMLAYPTETTALCENLADELDERGRHREAEELRDLIDLLAAAGTGSVR